MDKIKFKCKWCNKSYTVETICVVCNFGKIVNGKCKLCKKFNKDFIEETKESGKNFPIIAPVTQYNKKL